MASLPIMSVQNVIIKAEEKGEAIKNNRMRDRWGAGELREQYASTNDGKIFTLRHWGTEILKLNLRTLKILDYYGEGNSDRDAVQTALNYFGIKGDVHYYPSRDEFIIK